MAEHDRALGSFMFHAGIAAVGFSVLLGGLGALGLVVTDDHVLRVLWFGLLVPAVGLALVIAVPFRVVRHRIRVMLWALERIRAGDFDIKLPPPKEREAELFRNALMAVCDEVRRGRSVLEERDRERRRLYSHVVHDMATPLTTLIMSADLLRPSTPPGQLARVQAALDSLEELIERLRLLSVMEHPEFAPKFQPVELASFLRELISVYPADTRFEVSCEEITVAVCPKTLKTAVCNLIDNALVASQGAPVALTACATPRGTCEVVVTDRGPGFAQTGDGLDVPVTSPRLPNGIRGSGLGLLIARAAVTSLGGTLRIENVPGGSRVHVVFGKRQPTSTQLQKMV